MVLIVGDEGVISDGVLRVVGYNVVKSGGNFEGVMETSITSSTVINGDGEFNLTGTYFPSMTP